MANKITLITPPDFYENGNKSILLMGMTEEDMDVASAWLGEQDLSETNLYVYQNENNMEWLLYAANRADLNFINLDSDSSIITYMASYFLSKPNVFYTTKDANLKALLSYISNSYVSNIKEFLERAFDGQE